MQDGLVTQRSGWQLERFYNETNEAASVPWLTRLLPCGGFPLPDYVRDQRRVPPFQAQSLEEAARFCDLARSRSALARVTTGLISRLYWYGSRVSKLITPTSRPPTDGWEFTNTVRRETTMCHFPFDVRSGRLTICGRGTLTKRGGPQRGWLKLGRSKRN